MKRTRWLWATGLVAAGVMAGVLLTLAMGRATALAGHGGDDDAGTGIVVSADAAREWPVCDDDCLRSRGAAVLMELSQRPLR